MKDDRGYACGKCGTLSNDELQAQLKLDRLKTGRETLIAMGIDPDKEDEEELKEKEQEETENAMAAAMLDMTQELLDESTIAVEEPLPEKVPEAVPPPVNQSITTPTSKTNTTESVPADKIPESKTQAVTKNESISSQIQVDRPKPQVIEKLEENKNIVESDDDLVGIDEEDETFENFFEDEDKSDDLIKNDDDIDLADIFSDIENSDEDEEEIDESLSGEVDEILDDNEEEEDIPDEETEYYELNNKRFTLVGLTNRYNAIQNELSEKLGYIPYGDIKYNRGILEVSCKLCNKVFEINDLETLIDDVVTFTKENCVKYGLRFKSPLTISSCPHCRHSVLTNGYNEFHRKRVESVVEKSKLRIVNPENYWYATPLASYLLEANGVTQYINYIDLCNKYSGIDMSKHELFTPRGDDTKSKATSVENGKENIDSASFTLPKHDAKHQFHFDAVETSTEPIFERQQKKAESQMVFRPSDKFKNINENIAVLNGMENPFEREEKLDASFIKSDFYDFVKELAQECHVKFKYQINQKTFEIPVVDFEPPESGKTGFRLICADYNRNSMFNVPFPKVAVSVPFLFQIKTKGPTKYIYSVLYSDTLAFRREAAFNALIKYINPNVLAYGGKRIQLEGNLNIQYTDYKDYLDEFSEKYSPFPDGKPKSIGGEIGILASWASSKIFDAKDILETLASLENRYGQKTGLDKLENDFGLYMVASIRYIEKLNKDTGKIQYTITEYIEIGGALIADGFYQCIKALLKEYYLKYPEMRDRSPYIVIELDTNNFTSPSLRPYIQKETILPMDKIFKSQLIAPSDRINYQMLNHVEQHLLYTYVQKKEFRPKGVECIRKDIRKFSAKSLIRIMPDEIRAAGLQTGIFIDTQRMLFLQNMGYVYATQLPIKEYFVNQGIVQRILLEGETLLMAKAIDPDSVFSNSGIVDNSNNSISTINDPMFNPVFRAKMDRIRFGNVTPEAADFYNSYMMQKQQQMQNEYLAKQNQASQGVWQATPSPVDFSMTPGAYYMPNLPGINNQA
jgi:hypothetical protein